nr:hypothetical protein [uncultured Roseateles sp.]
MSDLRFTLTWGASESGEPEVRATAAHLGLYVGDVNLTRNEDIWSKSVRDNVFLAAYPLAQWLASSWWRLVYEPLPPSGKQPTHGWRMAHEVGAANHGFVWPNIVMACDTEAVQVWAAAAMSPRQSVQYLQSLPAPKAIPLSRFQRSIRDFIQATLTQLDAKALRHSDLAALWGIVLEDLADANAVRRRKLEAQLGFDPEECPPKALEEALRWGTRWERMHCPRSPRRLLIPVEAQTCLPLGGSSARRGWKARRTFKARTSSTSRRRRHGNAPPTGPGRCGTDWP